MSRNTAKKEGNKDRWAVGSLRLGGSTGASGNEAQWSTGRVLTGSLASSLWLSYSGGKVAAGNMARAQEFAPFLSTEVSSLTVKEGGSVLW